MVVIDVRSKTEYEQGHVDGALWFDVDKIANGEVPDMPRDEEIILYCLSGARSRAAMYILRDRGFTNVISGGGIAHMVMRGHKVVR